VPAGGSARASSKPICPVPIAASGRLAENEFRLKQIGKKPGCESSRAFFSGSRQEEIRLRTRTSSSPAPVSPAPACPVASCRAH
jgi:hypothetical protein